jgi:hypothetical protein
MGAGAPPTIREQQLGQFEQGRTAIAEKLDEAESPTGWALIQKYAPEWRKPEPQPEPQDWQDGLARGSMLPRGTVGATVAMASPDYLRQYQERQVREAELAEHQDRVRRGNEALALRALSESEQPA